jgi:ABC-type transport system substrate-binding protein
MTSSSRRFTRRRFLALGAGMAGGVILGACSADDLPATTATPTSVTSGTVRLRTRSAPPGMPPQTSAMSIGTLRGTSEVLAPIEQYFTYSRLVAVDPRTASVFGDLANTVEVVEPLTVRISLRPDVYFHPALDGGEARPVTAEAVALDFERRKSEGVFLFTDVVHQVEARGERDLVLRLRAPFGLLFEYLSRPDASIRGMAQYSRVDAPVGSGPFVPALTEGRDRLFAANPLVRTALAPHLSQVLVRGGFSDGELDTLFARGETHVRVHPDFASREAARLRSDRVELSRPGRSLRGLALSLLSRGDEAAIQRSQVLQDRRVRQAVATALNHEAIRGIDGSLLSGPVGPAHAGDALGAEELLRHPIYQHSPDGARTLLEAAGAVGLSLRILHADNTPMLTLAQMAADQLRQGGFDARLQPVSTVEFQAALIRGDFQCALVDLDGLDTPDLGLRLHTSGGLDGQRSLWGYSNPVYDAAVTAALSEVDPLHRARRSREAQRVLLDDIPALLPLSAPLQYASLAPGVGGYEFDGYEFNDAYLAPAWDGPVPVGPAGDE